MQNASLCEQGPPTCINPTQPQSWLQWFEKWEVPLIAVACCLVAAAAVACAATAKKRRRAQALRKPLLPEGGEPLERAFQAQAPQEPSAEGTPPRVWDESLGRPSAFMETPRAESDRWSSIVNSAAADGGVLDSVPRSCFIDIGQLEMCEAIGGGASGVVTEARYFASAADSRGASHVRVAVKQVELEIVAEEKDLLGREVRILASLRHPNLVAFIGIARSRRGVSEEATDQQLSLTGYALLYLAPVHRDGVVRVRSHEAAAAVASTPRYERSHCNGGAGQADQRGRQLSPRARRDTQVSKHTCTCGRALPIANTGCLTHTGT